MTDASDAHEIPQPGAIIAGKYQVERVLGKGGMGVVVSAWHTALRQRVAIKFLLPAALDIEEATGRLLREAQAAVAIKSEHVARVLDVGTLDSGSPYIIMEYLAGAELGQTLRARGPLPIAEAVDYMLQACEAIAEAHSLGIIHRDLKPGNIFLTTDAGGAPLIKVLDFGLSKVEAGPGDVDSSLTATHAVIGSPYYMSPEQMRSLKRVDARSDIWSLGVILYQLLTGKRPFGGESVSAIFAAVAADQPTPPRALRSDIPAALEAAILSCLEKDVARRTQTVADFARAIRPFGGSGAEVSLQRITRAPSLSSPGISAPVAALSAPVVGVADSTTAAVASWRAASSPQKRRRAVVVGAAASLIALVSIGAFLSFRTEPAAEAVSAPPSGADVSPAALAGAPSAAVSPAPSAPTPAPSSSSAPASSSASVKTSQSPSTSAPRAIAAPAQARPPVKGTVKLRDLD